MILPYLHDKKIFLNKIKDHTEYFYSSIETRPSDEVDYHKFLIKHLTHDDDHDDHDHQHIQKSHYHLKS